MGKLYPYSKKCGGNNVDIPFFGDIAIFLLFCDDEDILSIECEIWMTISQLIFTHKIYQRLFGTMITTIYKMGKNAMEILHIYGARAIFLLFYYDQGTEKE